MKDCEIIKIDGIEKKVYFCDRQAECKNSKYCGNECKFTFDPEHQQKQISLFD